MALDELVERISEQILEDEKAKALFNIKYFTHENELRRFVRKLEEVKAKQVKTSKESKLSELSDMPSQPLKSSQPSKSPLPQPESLETLIPYIDNMLDIPFFTESIEETYKTLRKTIKRTAELVFENNQDSKRQDKKQTTTDKSANKPAIKTATDKTDIIPELLSTFDKRYEEFTQAYNQKIREADELGRRLITKVTTEFNPRANLEPYLIDVYKEISKTFKEFLGARNLVIGLRKDSPFLKREKVQQLGRINPDGDVFKHVFFDIDRTKIKEDEKANEQLDKFEKALKKDWVFAYNKEAPEFKVLRENNILFFYTGKDYPYIIERDRGNFGRELGLMNSIEDSISDFLNAYFVKKLYHSLSDYFFGIKIPIKSKGKRISVVEVDALDVDLPELKPNKFLIDMREKYVKYKDEERPIIRAGTVKLLKKPENKDRRELIERAYAMEHSDDPDERLSKRGPFLLTRTEWNQILEEAGMKNPFRNKLIKTKDFIGYEIGEEEKKLYDEFFFLENRPVRAYKLKAAQHLADLIAPVLMTASKYYEIKQATSEDQITTIETKTREFSETIAHRLGTQINALRMLINRIKRQGKKLFPHLKEIRPLMDEVSEYVTELSEIVKQGGFNEEKRQKISKELESLKNKFESTYENIQESSELLEQLIEKPILDFESVSRTLKLFEPKEPATRNIYETLDEHIQQDHFLGDAGIKLKGKRSDIKVTASYGWLHEVYNIILENAREAILEKRKKVPDYVGEIEYGVEEFDKEHVLVYVKDDALGIPEGVDVFSRAYTTKGERHGLGLDLARYLMGEMNGSIAIRNRNQVRQKDKNNYEATGQEQKTEEQGTIVELVLPKRPYYDVFEARFLKDTYRDKQEKI